MPATITKLPTRKRTKTKRATKVQAVETASEITQEPPRRKRGRPRKVPVQIIKMWAMKAPKRNKTQVAEVTIKKAAKKTKSKVSRTKKQKNEPVLQESFFSDLAVQQKPVVNKTAPQGGTIKAKLQSEEEVMINEKLRQILNRSGNEATQTAEPTQQSNAKPAANISDPIAAKYDVRNISSLELTLLGNDLFTAGRINREELAMLAFQPELNQNYDLVGAQINCKPDPALPRNAIQQWSDVLENQQTFGCSEYFIAQTRRVLEILQNLDQARYGQ